MKRVNPSAKRATATYRCSKCWHTFEVEYAVGKFPSAEAVCPCCDEMALLIHHETVVVR